MNLPNELETREVIPNWRNFKTTIELGELSIKSSQRHLFFDLESLKNDFLSYKSIGTAADLINAQFIFNSEIDEVLDEAIHYINHSDKASKSLLEITNNFVTVEQDKELSKEPKDIKKFLLSQIRQLIDNQTRHQIRLLKKKLIQEPKNPISWVELARLYSIEGNVLKSEKAISNALYLSPNNRFVLRAATRLFIENSIPDKAIFYLRKSTLIKVDPWLTSAHLAVSSHINKFSPFIKNGIQQVNSNKFSSFDLTELNSSLGTIELNNGNIKKAKEFFNNSIKTPNDNSLAQAHFVIKHNKSLNTLSPQNMDVKNAFEALAIKHQQNGEWEKALENCLYWFLDVPYSSEPSGLGSYISCTVLEDFETSIELCELALKSNPNDTLILNNLIYSYLQVNRISDAERVMKLMEFNIKENSESLTRESGITYLATNALYLLKIKQIDRGIELYKEAIELSKKLSNKYYYFAAVLNLAKELKNINYPEAGVYIKEAVSFNLDDFKDLQVFRKRHFPLTLKL